MPVTGISEAYCFAGRYYEHVTVTADGHIQEAQLPQRNSASAAHVYLGWLTDRAMHKTVQNRGGCTISEIQTL